MYPDAEYMQLVKSNASRERIIGPRHRNSPVKSAANTIKYNYFSTSEYIIYIRSSL